MTLRRRILILLRNHRLWTNLTLKFTTGQDGLMFKDPLLIKSRLPAVIIG